MNLSNGLLDIRNNINSLVKFNTWDIRRFIPGSLKNVCENFILDKKYIKKDS
jgi:hypothetical protein